MPGRFGLNRLIYPRPNVSRSYAENIYFPLLFACKYCIWYSFGSALSGLSPSIMFHVEHYQAALKEYKARSVTCVLKAMPTFSSGNQISYLSAYSIPAPFAGSCVSPDASAASIYRLISVSSYVPRGTLDYSTFSSMRFTQNIVSKSQRTLFHALKINIDSRARAGVAPFAAPLLNVCLRGNISA